MPAKTKAQLIKEFEAYKFRTEVQLHDLTRRQQLSEGALAYSPPYDLVNPWELFYDGKNLLFPVFPSRLDYRTSSSYIWMSEPQLDLLRAYARFLYETNPTAQGIFKALANFVIEEGFRYEVQPKRGENPTDDLVAKCQRVIDDFHSKNRWRKREMECFRRSRRDGEFFLEFFPQDDGITLVRFIEPEQVRAPNGDPDWLFGMKVDPEDRETITDYHVKFLGPNNEGTTIPADEVFHAKINVDMGIKRGLSDLFSTQETLQNVQKLLRAEMMGEQVRASISYIRQYAQANQATIQSLQQQNTDYFVPEPTFSGSPRLQPVQKIEPGSVIDIPEGLEFQSPPSTISSEGIKILEAGLQQLAQRWQMPEWVVTGSSGSSSYASALTEESPFSRMVETEQRNYSDEFQHLHHRILDIAVQQKILPPRTCDLVEVQVVVPPVITRQSDKATNRYMTLHDKGVLSKRTWTNLESLDYQHEQENFKDDEGGTPDQLVLPEQPNRNEDDPSQQPDSDIRRK